MAGITLREHDSFKHVPGSRSKLVVTPKILSLALGMAGEATRVEVDEDGNVWVISQEDL